MYRVRRVIYHARSGSRWLVYLIDKNLAQFIERTDAIHLVPTKMVELTK